MRGLRVARAVLAGVLLVPVVAAAAAAHPLGNFTINHYAGIRVEPDRVLLDVVIDQAEIPTFQATMNLDTDGDGEFSAEEIAGVEVEWCTRVGTELSLTVDGTAAPMRVVEAGVTFPPGNGGLSTMRLVCTIESRFASPLTAPVEVAFADGFEPTRIGWREMTVQGSGVTVSGTALGDTSASERLSAYPSTLAAAPDVRSATFTVAPGGAMLPALDVPDASPIDPIELSTGAPASPAPTAGASASAAASVAPSASAAPSAATSGGSASASGGPGASATPGVAAVPGGEGAIPDILRALPVTPLVALLAFATAALLGAGHALTPGHGKTLMAAYLVGTRGTPRHALGLGAAVSVSHTFGILGLAVVVLAAESTLPPDLVVRVAPIIAALTIVAIGGWMLLTEVRRWAAARRRSAGILAAHEHVHDHGHTHEDGSHADGHSHAADHSHADGHPHADGHEHGQAPGAGLEHSHGGVRHRHVPPAGSTITWRSLAILGLAGGLIPSTNALLILLATIAAGQPAWGVVLVVAFGLGMAAVMAGVGLAFVYARGLIERGASAAGVGRVARLVPLAASIIVLVVGVALTTQAVGAARLG